MTLLGHGIMFYVFWTLVLLVIGTVLFAVWLITDVKKEVSLAPRKPMSVCDKHGAFDSSLMMTLSIPTTNNQGQPLIVERCPFCYDEAMGKAEKILTDAKVGK